MVKHLGMHYWFFNSNSKLVNAYGDFGERITACATELEIVAQHSHMAMGMLAELNCKMDLLGPPLQRILGTSIHNHTFPSKTCSSDR